MTRYDLVVVAILAKDKEAALPLYLKALESQSYPKKKLAIWIRSNNNSDRTAFILENWIKRNSNSYHSVQSNFSDVESDIKAIGNIRQESIEYAMSLKAHYFVADCDNFILPNVLKDLYKTNLHVVAPMLRKESDNSLYANYHSSVDKNGYYSNGTSYETILERNIRGLIQVPVVNGTYFVKNEVLPYVSYVDGTQRHAYVIFSESLRNSNIHQYLDNRDDNGFLSFAKTMEDLIKEPRWKEFKMMFFDALFLSESDSEIEPEQNDEIEIIQGN